MANKYLEFAEVRQSKEGDTYIVFTKDLEVKATDYKGNVQEFNFKKGNTIFKDSPQSKIQALVERGIITESQAEERLGKTPDYILQILTGMQKD